MDSHIRGPAKAGQGSMVGQRGLRLLYTDAAATTELLTVEGQNLVKEPVLVEITAVVETGFDGTGASLTVQVTPEGGAATDLIAAGGLTETAAGSAVARRVCYARDKFTVVWAPGTGGTAGRGAVFAQIAGIGQLT